MFVNEMEMVNGGSVATMALRVAGGLASMAVGMVAEPVGAIAAGLLYAGASIAVDEFTNK